MPVLVVTVTGHPPPSLFNVFVCIFVDGSALEPARLHLHLLMQALRQAAAMQDNDT